MNDSSSAKKNKPLNTFVERKFNISTYDIDIAGHVNNVVHVRWLEDLRTELVSKICDFKELLNNNLYPVVTSTEIFYKKQIKYFDNTVGIMELAEYRHGMFLLKAVIKSGDEISASATQKFVIINLSASKICHDLELKKYFHGIDFSN
ncbi:MAG: thioesterase family protein [Bacteroidetes bacterium]|nr:thioesterase family protein [Bacteroidota bacterium]